ncbi:tripartite tricarboxylate transporter TctB family protein [Psychromarinibacter sp. C21-152]|uniref:Tripartite tricarboxylate transporter TctB family protein n=1 Tax=Psychromarinibacter sediminicola TaxID=3033385 RepID=A0AAE3TAU6_9RHOB|nr:tripartite tricarboxylate transporter TctB family protein [Psychromarinibacter sediminicola]MDF0603218.1 tripartite tricarboxylate transporter TctB family protein [Psychromarinibacter sediminicola]
MSVRLAGVAIFMIAALFTWYGRGYTASFGDVLGPGVFPVIVGIPAMILSASLVVFPSGQVEWPERPYLVRQLAALAILAGYAWLLGPLGFPLATFGLIVGIGIVLGGAPLKAVILGALFAPALWALFDQVLGLPLAVLGDWFG